jgi:hypothetical protein
VSGESCVVHGVPSLSFVEVPFAKVWLVCGTRWFYEAIFSLNGFEYSQAMFIVRVAWCECDV